MNHRTTSACNCISVPIINVSTATLFTKAVIIKSQVGEIWNTNAYLKKPFLCNWVSKYPDTKFAVAYEFSWGVYFWNSILNWSLGIWFLIKNFFFLAGVGGITYGFLNSFWTQRRIKVRNRSFFPHKPIIWILDPLSMGGERRCFAPSFLVKNVYSQSRRRDYTFPTSTHSTPTNHPHLEGLLAFTLLVKCQDTLKLLTTNVEKNEA